VRSSLEEITWCPDAQTRRPLKPTPAAPEPVRRLSLDELIMQDRPLCRSRIDQHLFEDEAARRAPQQKAATQRRETKAREEENPEAKSGRDIEIGIEQLQLQMRVFTAC